MLRGPQAQKRFRERQKTKFAELTSKVEQLEARLAGVLAEKAKSEDRALILERCLELRGGLQLPAAASSSAVQSEVRDTPMQLHSASYFYCFVLCSSSKAWPSCVLALSSFPSYALSPCCPCLVPASLAFVYHNLHALVSMIGPLPCSSCLAVLCSDMLDICVLTNVSCELVSHCYLHCFAVASHKSEVQKRVC